MKKNRVTDLIAEIEDEMRLLRELVHDIQVVGASLPREMKERTILAFLRKPAA